jgi:YesN/AraC family two-component response regulator
MVVEDSKPILRNIVKLLETIDKNLVVVETAFNGEEALQKLRNNSIDILFTDIRMPKMDGLQLIEQAKKIKPNIKCVIISGYDDFEYARQAMKLQVYEYILKPVDREELEKIVSRLVQQLDIEKKVEFEKKLSDIVINNIYQNNFDFPIKTYQLAIVRVGLLKKGKDVINKDFFKSLLDKLELLKHTWIIETGFCSESLLLFDVVNLKDVYLFNILETLLKEMNRIYQQVNIILSSILTEIREISHQYLNLSNTLSSLIRIGESKLFEQKNLSDLNLSKLNEEAKCLEKKFKFILENKQINTFKKELLQCIENWKKNMYPAIFIRRFLTIIVEYLNNSFATYETDTFLDISYVIDRMVEDCYSYDDIYTKIEDYLDKLLAIKTSETNSKKRSDELVDKIITFLRANIYGNITLQDVADKFNVSPSYINRLMRKRYNTSTMEYYMWLKIEEAKRLLSSDENILIKDVAEGLGFSDQHYFSKVFKMYVGMNPTDFKNKNNPNVQNNSY